MARRREQNRLAEGNYVESDIAKIRERLGDSCHYCDAKLDGGGEVDHMVPIALGGTHWPGNLTLACRACNRAKHGKTAEEFVEWRRERGLSVRCHKK